MLEVVSRTLTEKIRRLYNSVGKRSASLWCSVQLRFFPVKENNYYHVSEVQVLEMRYNGYNDAWNSLKKKKKRKTILSSERDFSLCSQERNLF